MNAGQAVIDTGNADLINAVSDLVLRASEARVVIEWAANYVENPHIDVQQAIVQRLQQVSHDLQIAMGPFLKELRPYTERQT